MQSEIKQIITPLSDNLVIDLSVGDKINISGKIYCGRDAVLPKICELIDQGRLSDYGIDLEGAVIFHSAVSMAGLGPTSSNKLEIERSIPKLAQAGVKIHLGKGALSEGTILTLDKYNSVYAVIPPVTALLTHNVLSQKIVAFPELGMEAFYELDVKNYPGIIAASKNQSIYSKETV